MRGFRNIAFAGAAVAAISIAAPQVQAAGEWTHNDSVMKLVENGKKRRFVYERPRKGLETVGVTAGTILFDGEEKQDGRLSGYAKLFRKGCDPIDYFVEGTFDKKKGEAILQGQVPIYSGEGCKITGYTDNGKASKLHFTRLDGGADRVAAIPKKEERPGYLPPEDVIGEPAREKRGPVARTEAQGSPESDLGEPRPQPPQRSVSRVEEEPYEELEESEEAEVLEDEPVYRDYNWRQRRAERDRRYADEDAAYFAERWEDEEDDAEYYEDDYDDDGPAYYPERLR